MQNHNLIIITAQFLDLIIDMYNSGKISYEVFYDISRLKIKFLKDNILYIPLLEESKEILSVLNNYDRICLHLESEFR